MPRINRRDMAWSAGIGVYIGIIYATAPFISAWRKTLVEAFGYGIYDWMLWIFAPPILAVLLTALRRRRGRALARPLVVLAGTAVVFGWYLMQLKYPIERLHFAQYGLLGGLLSMALRRGGPAVSALLALMLTYLAGLGDEWIQHLSPHRVGEIRDAGLNGLAGLPGICLVQELSGPGRLPPKGRLHVRVRCLQGTGTLAVAATLAFLAQVHGFGHRIESPEAGIFFSAFSASELKAGGTVDGRPLLSDAMYIDEGDRHLFQREFYCANDYLAADGSYYRKWSFCWMENAVLVGYYSSYLEKYAGHTVESRLERLDREFARKVAGNPVIWTEETGRAMQAARPHAELLTSRVKSTLLTGTSFPELLFFALVALWIITWIGEQFLCLAPRED